MPEAQLPTRRLLAEAIRASWRRPAVMICFADQGAGITQEQQPRIFDRFRRGNREQNRKGTGMGWAIAREIIRAHGQQIWVSSKPGRGSEVCFRLPVACQDGQP